VPGPEFTLTSGWLAAPMTYSLVTVGRVLSPLVDAASAPKQGDEGAPPASLVIEQGYLRGIADLAVGSDVLVLTWLDRARRDVLTTRPRDDPSRAEQGVFSTRSPDRPNPIGLHRVRITSLEGDTIGVDGLEALDGTPVLDLKPVLGTADER
jgi:tRNA-Thr(GGU) m(6)t(6)A37 methyltransferase TsaA